MPYAKNGPVELFYEQWGTENSVPLLLIMGLSAQMISWDDSLMERFVAHGFNVVRFDNRDVGKSTWFDDAPIDIEQEITNFLTGQPLGAPYSIGDMASDVAAVMDAVGWESAHILGASMGGMIAQSFAIGYPERTRTLTSIMSTTGDMDVGQPDSAAAEALMKPSGDSFEEIIDASVETSRIICSPIHFDPVNERERAIRAYERAYNPSGVLRQLIAILTQQSRTEALQALDLPALVIHGKLDPLVNISGGQRTHQALKNSELVILDEAGHDIPEIYRADLVGRVAAMAEKADAR